MDKKQMTQESLSKALEGLPVGEICFFERVGSTNDCAFERAAAGAPDMSVITAFEQEKGRGRMQRQWVTVPGTSVPVTVIIRPDETEMGFLNLFSPLTGLAVREALRLGFGIRSLIKWPNDILLNRKKICGILCETQWEGPDLRALILGFGTNLLHGSAPDIADINYPASSVEDETGIIIRPAEWIRCFLEQLIRLRPLLGSPEFFALWESCLAYKDEQAVIVRPDGTSKTCTVRGIDHEGNLVTENADGSRESHLAGEISLRVQS